MAKSQPNKLEKQIANELKKTRVKQVKGEAKQVMQKLVDAKKVVENLEAELKQIWEANPDLIGEEIQDDNNDNKD